MIGNEEVSKVAVLGNGGIISTIKDRIQLQSFMEKLMVSKDTFFDIGLYAGVGFLSGFLLKKYSQYLIFSILFITGCMTLQQLNLMSIVINWQRVHELMGTQPMDLVIDGNTFMLVFQWMKTNGIMSVSLIIGFLLGLKIG